MKRATYVFFSFMLIWLAGCGPTTSELETIRDEQRRGFEQMRDQISALNQEVGRLRRNLADLDSEVFDLRGQVGFGLVAGRGTGPSESGATHSVSSVTRARLGGEPVAPLEAETLEELANAVAKLQDQLMALREEFIAERELADLRDPRRTWEAMNDPKQLSVRLDRFANVFSRTVEDDVKRAEFLADARAIKDDVDARAALSKDELVAQYRAKLTERVHAETNERLRRWYGNQLRMLENTDSRATDSQLATFQRYDVAQALKDLAKKYGINDQQLRDNGLQTYGGAYGWQ